ncbi:class I SAM-dependent methyltransferase [Cohnella cellulosilytica]|uniref:Class I SAM-dependent methyltransferase n=1 Tax=Cohnella cellulosilytica TaxID=986710 RepID=A0ABW2F593_9BACL
MIVTTSQRPTGPEVERALRLADELGAVYVPRGTRTIRALQAAANDAQTLVVGPRDIRLTEGAGQPFYFHPSMALVRIKGLLAGGRDSLLEVSGAKPGDTVIDCTAGLCSDSLVFSHAVGERGQVVALEAARTVHVIVREGLRTYESGLPEADKAMRTIEAVHADCERWLPRMPDDSADIVYFDPMFEKPVTSSSAIAPLRAWAADGPLAEEAVREAIRVARRKVVLKDHRDSGRFERLGFRLAKSSSSAVAYGVIDVE